MIYKHTPYFKLMSLISDTEHELGPGIHEGGLEGRDGGGHGNPLQYSCLENPLDRGAWLATVHSVAKSRP